MIVKTNNEIYEKNIRVGGYDMTLTPCRRFINSCKAKIDDDIPYVMFVLESMLEREDVADRLMNEVRIGSSAIVVDEVNGFTYFLQMDIEDLYIMDIHNHSYEPLEPRPNQPVMVVSTRGLLACA
ncbi:MAG: hypothetical protein LBV27_08880 [Oscillospiraceae bacterium]|nr:hypothetical protein [Oscillospiraceae bacterium]